MSQAAAREQFQRIAALPDERVDLAEAALWIAAEEFPGLDVAAELSRLDELAELGRAGVESAAGPAARIAALNRFLYEEQGFAGNRSDYYDAHNSFLNVVLERRSGIPITLAIVYMGVGRRLGLSLCGVGFPGHFLVKTTGADEIVIDPFEGRVLALSEVQERWAAAAGPDVPLDPRALAASPARQIVARVLGNLKQIWLAQEDWPRALGCVERLLVLAPDAPLELRDRGLLFARLECFAAAADDLRRFLVLAPGDPTAAAVRAQLAELVRGAPSLH